MELLKLRRFFCGSVYKHTLLTLPVNRMSDSFIFKAFELQKYTVAVMNFVSEKIENTAENS